MIIQIDGIFFNPEAIIQLSQKGDNVLAFFSSAPELEDYLVFKNWKICTFAAEINRCIEEFHIDNYIRALNRFQAIVGLYDGKESLKTKSG